MMKRFIAILLSCTLILGGCGVSNPDGSEIPSTEVKDVHVDISTLEQEVSYENLSDPELLTYVENAVYTELVTSLDSDTYFVENVEAIYYSKEYLEELAYNSQSNIYFGFTLAEIDQYFQGERYVFTLGEDGQTIVQPFEKYDDTYDQIIKNVVTGTGVILLCVTVSVVTGGSAPAVSMIFAASAKSGTIMALSSGVIGGVASGVVTGIETGDFDEAMKAAALSGSEGFKWGALSGSISGGVAETVALKGATLNGLTMNQAAAIQKESKYPLDVIKQFHSVEEYNVFKNANLKSMVIDGKSLLVRSDINLDLVDEYGRTNLERMKLGLSALDENGMSYELHHVGQNANGTLAILSTEEHKNAVLHGYKAVSEIDRNAFAQERKQVWMSIANLIESGGL